MRQGPQQRGSRLPSGAGCRVSGEGVASLRRVAAAVRMQLRGAPASLSVRYCNTSVRVYDGLFGAYHVMLPPQARRDHTHESCQRCCRATPSGRTCV